MKRILLALLMVVPMTAWGETFGVPLDFSGGGSSGLSTANKVVVSKHTLSEAGTVTKITQRLIIATGTPYVKGLIFADSSGSPGELLGVTAASDCGVNWEPRWIDMTFSSGIELEAGTYWIGLVIDSNGANTYHAPFSGGSEKEATDNSYTSPTDWNATAYTEASYSFYVYATYTPAGGGTPATFGYPQVLILE